jgi:protein-S-isoprenylcysteine O-methyltransferase Ste14
LTNRYYSILSSVVETKAEWLSLNINIRIQKDRKQTLISTGVYGFVRHPMYFGGILLFIGAPLLLGSLWGIIIGFALTLLLAGRIVGEEKMLTDDLAGYAEYKKRVQYRLIPFVW